MLCYVLAGILVFTSVLLIGWTISKSNDKKFRVAQPIFLNLLLVGSIICTCALFFLPTDAVSGATPADIEFASLSCMMFPWLFTLGLGIQFGSLIAKITRYVVFSFLMNLTLMLLYSVEKIFINPKLKMVKVSAMQMQKIIVLIFVVNVIVLGKNNNIIRRITMNQQLSQTNLLPEKLHGLRLILCNGI